MNDNNFTTKGRWLSNFEQLIKALPRYLLGSRGLRPKYKTGGVYTKSPIAKRRAKRRRKNRAAKQARKLNRRR